MNKISCDVCMDLMPLVKDDIASNDSRLLVEEHIETCKNCRMLYNKETETETKMDDKVVILKIKKQISYLLIIVILIGTVFGMMLTNSMNMFYNALIMPIIGGLGYILLNKKVFIFPIGLFLFSTVWHTLHSVFFGYLKFGATLSYIFLGAITYSAIYSFFCIIGIVIAWLMAYAFGRDKK